MDSTIERMGDDGHALEKKRVNIQTGLALLIAVVGTYGLLSYGVTNRRREIGIRMALGASRSGILTTGSSGKRPLRLRIRGPLLSASKNRRPGLTN